MYAPHIDRKKTATITTLAQLHKLYLLTTENFENLQMCLHYIEFNTWLFLFKARTERVNERTRERMNEREEEREKK